MNIIITSIHFTADSKLEKLLENKISKLSQFHDSIITANVYLKIEKNQDSDNKITEIKLDIPGSELFAKKQSNSFEKAADSTIEALKKQLLKVKEKQKK
ncbi:MAG: ribosome-associated translation inhibitor RaiA [Bacteroidales bacterium]|nr:ribosome-associated translation inhibitor RaiA [Bacteroidales bacterium]MBN2758145.1 ribosome-associated translation inhibitor RaiA [Bacteroidales bacterium]